MTHSEFNERMEHFGKRIGLWERKWLKSRPCDWYSGGPLPTLFVPGLSMYWQPDGLFLGPIAGAEALDAIVLEHSGTISNVEMHRGRYVPHSGAVAVRLPNKWLLHPVPVEGSGTPKACEILGVCEPDKGADPTNIPIRHLEVLYVVPKDVLAAVQGGLPVHGFEYFIRETKFHWPFISNTNVWGTNLLKHLTRESHFFET